MRIFSILILSLLLTSCGAPQPPAPALQDVTLPSGKHVKVLGIGKVAFSSSPPALMLKYETDLSIDETVKLSQEADEIWAAFRTDVEKAGLTTGIISANERPSGGIVSQNRGFNFVYQRGTDGAWSRVGG